MSSTYERLHALVTTGALRPGARLGDANLAVELGVSRPTVREALRRLEASGLADSDGRSLRVAQLDETGLRSALLMRASLEALHAELAAIRIAEGEVAPAELRTVDALADEAERATNLQDARAAAAANRAFHQAIDALAASPVSVAAVDRLWDQIMVATERSLASADRREAVNREHRRLTEALFAGDAATAAGLASRHVRATLEATELAPAHPPDEARGSR
jgi:DNA-binding GntR family transcriptional regulator